MITGVRVFDMDRFGKGGLAKIIDGGLHQDHATINFISKPGEPMLFTVIINGYCVQNHQIQSNANNVQQANPINYREPVATPPMYGWIPPLNDSLNDNSSSVVIQNITTPSNSSNWWHFW